MPLKIGVQMCHVSTIDIKGDSTFAMCLLPMWALSWQLFNGSKGWFWTLWPMLNGEVAWAWKESHLWSIIGLSTLGLQIWMIIEACLLRPKAKGVLEAELPPLRRDVAAAGGRSC